MDTNADGVIWVKKVEDPSAFGVVKLDDYGFITDFVEKPKEYVSDLAIIGIYYFNSAEKLMKDIAEFKKANKETLEIRKNIASSFNLSIKAMTPMMQKLGVTDEQLKAIGEARKFVNDMTPSSGRGGQGFANIFGGFSGKMSVVPIRSSIERYTGILKEQEKAQREREKLSIF